jgi:DNA (cytosine-5)-methyltransferase 1
MDYLSLFSGAGGGDLAMQHLLGFKCKGYVEYEPYCQELIKQRIKDGLLHAAPIFGDIRDFNREYAECYQSMVDLITGGFPCQPFSLEGKQRGEDDSRNMWPQTIKTIGIVRPAHVLLENVPGILAYLPVVIRDLRRAGYTVQRPRIISSGSTGALHIRKRIWIHSHANSNGRMRQWDGLFTPARIRPQAWSEFEGLVSDILQSCVPASKGNGIHDAIPRRVDRLKATGNGQDPLVAATAWDILTGGIR